MKVIQWTGWIFIIKIASTVAFEPDITNDKIVLPFGLFLSTENDSHDNENNTTYVSEERNSTESSDFDFVSELMTALMNTDEKSSETTLSQEETSTNLLVTSSQDSIEQSSSVLQYESSSSSNNLDEIEETSTPSKILYFDESMAIETSSEHDLMFENPTTTSIVSSEEIPSLDKLETVINSKNPFDIIVTEEEPVTDAKPTLTSTTHKNVENIESEPTLTPISISIQTQTESNETNNAFHSTTEENTGLNETQRESSFDNQTATKHSEKREPKFAETFFGTSKGNGTLPSRASGVNAKDTSNRKYSTPRSDPSYGNSEGTEYHLESVEVFSDSYLEDEKNHKNTLDEQPSSYVFSSVRQIHPESSRPNVNFERRPELIDRVRPLHPDPVDHFPYFRPTPDSRTPVVKEEPGSSRSSRPDGAFQRASFRPSYGQSKSTQSGSSFIKLTGATTAKPLRVSYKPYQPQSSFGRPYRPPTYQKPSSTTPEEIPSVPFDNQDTSKQGYDASDFSRADYDYSKSPSSSFGFSKHFPTYDTSKPSIIYPKPSFGSNYQPQSSVGSPFAAGSVVGSQNLTKVEFIKADCFNNHMKVTMRFNGSFTGLVYSSGYAQDTSCNYINGSGGDSYDFFIRLNRCGTIGKQEVPRDRLHHDHSVRDERAQYLVNTITVQYNPVIEEDIDEHFKVTCEYGYDFWKTVTFPMINVESSISKSPSLKIRTGSPVVFTLPPPQCNMEIRRGYGLTGQRVSGPVSVGDPLTLVIHMKSESQTHKSFPITTGASRVNAGFDILVSNCFAHNGAQKRLQLLNSDGCVVENQIVTDFRGVKSPDRRQQITLYSYLKTFRFTGSPALYIECDVHMCHGTCPSQRCHWRKLFKRSLEGNTTTTPDSLMSDSISLFQALEVRHEDVDQPDLLPLRHSGNDSVDLICLKTGGFAAMLACFLLLLMVATASAVCMCLRLRKIKRLTQEPDTKHFVELSGNMSFN